MARGERILKGNGQTKEHAYFIEDVVRGQWSSGKRNYIMRETAKMDRARKGQFAVRIFWEEEGGSSGKDASFTIRQVFAGFAARPQRVTGSKEIRAEPFARAAEDGQVWLIQGAWNASYIDEVTAFPNAAHDDQVDTTSGAYNALYRRPTARNLVGFA